MQAEGFGGEVRAGYAIAARIEYWRLVPNVDGRHVVSGDIRPDRFLIQREPLKLILRLGDLSWTWEDAKFENGRVLIEGAPVEGVKVLNGA